MKPISLYKALFVTFVAILTVSCNDTLDQLLGFLSSQMKTVLAQARYIAAASTHRTSRLDVCENKVPRIRRVYWSGIWIDQVGIYRRILPPSGTTFKEGAVIDSVRAVVSYTTIMGDSLAPMQLSVYEVTKSLEGATDYAHQSKRVCQYDCPFGIATIYRQESLHTEPRHTPLVTILKHIGCTILTYRFP